MAKVLVNITPKKMRWWRHDPEGTMEEKLESYEKANEYLYKILDYCEKETRDDDEIKKLRRDFVFLKQGPWAGTFAACPRHKLTSADVLYLLTSSLPAEIIAKKFDINFEEVRRIRRGHVFNYYQEYLLIRRLTTLIKSKLKNERNYMALKTYKISRLIGVDQYEDLYFTTSMRRANTIRKDIIPKKEFERLSKNKELDIVYPIKEIDIL